MKKINILGLLLMALTFFTGCKEESIVLTSELPQFELREGLMLLEVIVPYGTGQNDQIYIYGDFNGGEDAIGNPEWLLQRATGLASGTPAKFGIYINPNSFQNGKTLADGYTFYSIQTGQELNVNQEPVWHTEYPQPGQRINVFVNYWEDDFLEPENPEDVPHDGYAIYILNNSTWTDLYMWAWPEGSSGQDFLGVDWPGVPATGTILMNGTKYTYFDTGAKNSGQTINVIISDNGSPQTDTFGGVELNKDWYFELTADGQLVELDPSASTPHDGYAIFIYNNNATDFQELYAWVWPEGGSGDDFLGVGWPGVPFTGTQSINGVIYNYYDFGSQHDGMTVNFIVNNNNQGKQAEVDGLVLDKNYYYELSGTKLTEIDPETFKPGDSPSEPSEPSEPDVPTPDVTYNIYIQNETGWSDFYLYTWGGSEIFGGWPGQTSNEVATVGGEEYLVFEVPGNGAEQTLIFNNNAGTQIEQGDMKITLDQNYYIKVTATEATFLETPEINIYADNQTGWDAIALYAWSNGNPELFGGWPGLVSTTTETINGVNYLVYPAPANGLTYNLIFNNNNGGTQLENFGITLNQDAYLKVTAEGVQFTNE